MAIIKDIIDEHESNKEKKEKQRAAQNEEIEKRNIEISQKWNEHLNKIILPILAEVKEDFKSGSYGCEIKQVPFTAILPSSGKTLPGIEKVELQFDLQKRTAGTTPYKASIIFSLAPEKMAFLLQTGGHLRKQMTPKTIPFSDGPEAIKDAIRGILEVIFK